MKSLIFVIALFSAVQVVAQLTTCIPNGTTGNVWVCSTKGAKGDTGARGPAGLDGKDGAPGQPGQTGMQGNPGNDGKDGAAGQPGKDGKDGANGAPGATGATGAQGPPGVTPSWTVDTTIDWTKELPTTMAVISLAADNQTIHCTLRSGQPCKF